MITDVSAFRFTFMCRYPRLLDPIVPLTGFPVPRVEFSADRRLPTDDHRGGHWSGLVGSWLSRYFWPSTCTMTHHPSCGIPHPPLVELRFVSLKSITFGLSDPDIQRVCGRGQCGGIGQRHLHSFHCSAQVPRLLGVDPWRRDAGQQRRQQNGEGQETPIAEPKGTASCPGKYRHHGL